MKIVAKESLETPSCDLSYFAWAFLHPHPPITRYFGLEFNNLARTDELLYHNTLKEDRIEYI